MLVLVRWCCGGAAVMVEVVVVTSPALASFAMTVRLGESLHYAFRHVCKCACVSVA